VGVGAPLSPAVLRLMLATKAASLARGHSGVRPEVVQCLLDAFNAGLVPYVPSQGSVGASGDLAPLAHMTLALMGVGEMLVEGERRPAAPVLQAAGLAPLELRAKEGLALINGTQTSTALALHALLSFEPVLEAALVVGALTVDAARGSDGPFDPRILALRGQPGQIDVAQYYRLLLAGSAIRRSHLVGDDRVQDPYSLRCQPQVVGATGVPFARWQRRPAAEVLRVAGIAPLQLAAKEGLALINGTQTSTALALHALLSFEPVLESALVIGALTVDAARGSDGPFDPRIHALRGQPGQIDVARYYRALLQIGRAHV
jgi:histidine ammonia-lyase